MIDGQGAWMAATASLAAVLAVALLAWAVSIVMRNAGIADIVWGMFFLAALTAFYFALSEPGPRSAWVPVLVVLWALRLSCYIGWRNHGQPEDRRYQQIRARNQPNFAWKSLYLVFGLQGLLAWIISVPVLTALASEKAFGWLDAAGILVFAIGWLYETVADFQLARFKTHQGSTQGKVLDTGLWRYSRHPNYFGECCVWWGFYLIAVSAGAGWTIFSPMLITVLLLKISGVALLEKDITERRSTYRQYIECTNSFIPGLPREKARNE